MTTTPTQFIATQKASVDALLAAQHTVFSGFEKLVDLNLRVAKAFLDEASEKTQEALSSEDPQQVYALLIAGAQPSPEKAVAYSKHVYDILVGTQNNLSRVAESHMTVARQQMVELMDQVAKNAPAGAEGVVALSKSALSGANSVYDSFTKAAKQAAVVTESNVAAATSATFDAAQESSKTAAAAARRNAPGAQ